MQLLAKNMAATHVHTVYTPFGHAFAYAIKQTPYAFVAKIILCMYLLYVRVLVSELDLTLKRLDKDVTGGIPVV